MSLPCAKLIYSYRKKIFALLKFNLNLFIVHVPFWCFSRGWDFLLLYVINNFHNTAKLVHFMFGRKTSQFFFFFFGGSGEILWTKLLTRTSWFFFISAWALARGENYKKFQLLLCWFIKIYEKKKKKNSSSCRSLCVFRLLLEWRDKGVFI